ncbi:MAG: DMT family transporter [bacterium]|nr:DMT family transporter [bacterium]
MSFFEKHPMFMIAIGVVGISLSSIFVKYAQAPSLVTASYRMLWTLLFMTPFVFRHDSCRRELKNTSRRTLLLCAASGIFLALHFVLWFESLNHTSVASSTTIVCTEVIWVALGGYFLLKRKLSPRELFCIGITIFGSMLIAFSDSSSGGNHLYGDFLAFLAALMTAGYTILGSYIRLYTSNTIYTYVVYLFCGLVLVATAFFSKVPLTGYGLSAWVVGLLLSVFSTILGHSIFSWCLRFLSPAFVSASKLLEPVVASVFAIFLFQEVPAWLQLLGGMIILAGVLIYSSLEKLRAA